MPPTSLFRRGASRAPARSCVLAASLVLLVARVAVAGDPCVAWPGEPSPLPTVADASPARARWAELRVSDLVARAAAIEAARPVEAYKLWRHAVCLEPGRADTRRAAERTRPIRVHRPSVVRSPGAAGAAVAANGDAWASLAAPVAVTGRPYVDAEARADARRVVLANVDRRLAEGEEMLRQARFREVLVAGEDVRGRLDLMRGASDLDGPRVRLEVLTATAALALGDEAAVDACLVRAIAVRPDLILDPTQNPPKLIRALESARAAAEPSR